MPNEVDSLLLDSVSPHCAEEPASLTETTCFIDGDYRDHVDACKNDCKALRDGVSSRATAAAKTESATSKCTPWSCLPCWRKKEPTKPKKEHRDVVVMPTEISGVDEPLLRTLATVASKMYAEELMASYEDGAVFTKAGGEHGEGTKALDLFKSSLACYGKVVDGIIDWSGEAEAYFTPDLTLALTLVTLTLTLILTLTCRPRSHRLLRSSSSRKTETWATYEPALTYPKRPLHPVSSPNMLPTYVTCLWQAPILILAWRGSTTMLDFINDVAFSPTLCRPRPHPRTDRIQSTPALALHTEPNPDESLTLGLTPWA